MDEGMDAQAGVKHDPNADTNPFAVPFSSFEMAHRYWVMDEDCLFLNVWTKHIPGAVENETVPDGDWNRPVKRPVLLWLHGGGYGAGSAIEIPAYDGHNLSEFGDVVVVSINHRLNCIGFLDLSSFGEEFQYSGIAGMADIVLALGWIRDNIGAFGGDPDNITVAGQSGGGGKATNLLQMPPADGLFHKVISQSGAFRDRPDMSVATEKRRWQLLGQKTVEFLGLDADTVSQIRTVSYERLSKAAEQAGKELGYPEGLMLFEPSPTEGWFTGYYNSSGFRPESAHIPVIAGTVGGEFNFMHYLGDKSKYSGEEVKKLLLDCYGEDTERILELFRAAYPGLHDLYALSMDTTFRPGTVAYLDARSAYTDAPCYNYQMNFVIPYLGGILPWHCACIPFMFRNVEMEPAHCTAADTYAEKVQDEVSRAWIRFMETGDPSTEDLPWDRYSPSRRCRMIFSERSGMTDTSDDELMELVGRHIPVFL
jgi:para-nitrobenzyl esterase